MSLLAKTIADAGMDHKVINASITGETTGGGLARLPELLEAHQPGLVVIELGGNDGLRGYPVDRIRDNLRSLVRMAEHSGANVVLLGMRIPPNYGKRYTDAFYATFAHVAAETNAVYVPFILDGIATDPELMQDDGVHPRAAAQPLLVDNAWPAIRAALRHAG